ncbi:MAG: hypothetical protein QOF84_7710 [Streptomyces sp.]|nr:hypothetical protein [Streptomyces sp.]
MTARRRSLTATLAVLAVPLFAPATLARAATSGDITADILANRNVALSGDAVVKVPGGTTTYSGVISGTGTLTVRGSGTLILTRDSDFTLPKARQRQSVRVLGGNHPYATVSNADAPAITVERGATLQYGTGGGTGLIGHFPYNTPGYQQNQDNIRVDGTLRLSLTRAFNLGIISGSGLVTQPRNMWGTLQIASSNPFSGVFDNGTGVAFGATVYPAALPNARKILNQGSWIIDTPLYQTIVQRQVFYNREYGSDINVHSRPGSKVILTGYYSWSDGGSDSDPTLSDPSLNWKPVAHNLNKRGTNIEGANVQWGDGTTHQIFMPGTAQTVYINLHAAGGVRSRLAFAYNGPVTLGAPIGGGKYHDTLAAPGAGDIVVTSVPGNDVTFAAAQYYDGSTTIEKGATLHLGTGKSGGDGSLYKGSLYKVIDNGSLVVRNRTKALSLSRISGSGSFTQAGVAPVTLTGAVSYTGATTVSRGMLTPAGASLKSSSGVRVTGPGAVLDLRRAGKQTVRNLSVAEGGTLRLGSQPLTVSGTVRLGGSVEFDLEPAKVLKLVDNSGKDKVSGVFSGLPQNRTITVAGQKFHISYTAGDGNDIALIKGVAKKESAATASAPAASAASAGTGATTTDASVATTAADGTPPWRAALFSLLGLVGVGLYVARRQRGGRRRSRHARS